MEVKFEKDLNIKKEELEEENEIELRSDEVQEILTDVPNWMIRYGITLIFTILLAIIALSWFIKYPQVIPGAAELTTKNPPAILVANGGGYIQKIHIEENQPVRKNQLIAELRNPIDQAVVDTLQNIIDTFSLGDVKPLIDRLSAIGELGAAQNALNSLYSNLIEYEQVMHDESYRRTIRSLGDQIRYNKHLAILSENQTSLFEAELDAAREKYASDSVLYANGVIAKMTFFNNQSEYFAKRQALLDAKKAAIQHQVAATNFAEQKNQLERTREDRKRLLVSEIQSALKSLGAFTAKWKLNYTIYSPIDGQLAYFENLNENDYVRVEQPLFTVIPKSDEVLGIVQIDQEGYGKIQTGQEVRIKLGNYPFQEYGQLKGSIESISKVAGENGYTVKVEFEKGMTTTYNRQITYQPGMVGTAEIVTEDLRLIERIFNSIRKIFDR